MLAIRRFYNKNKKMIWITLVSLVAIIVILRILDTWAKKEIENKNVESSSNEITTTFYKENTPVVTDQKVRNRRDA